MWRGSRTCGRTSGAMPELRVCPFCGEPPGPGTFCAACGRNLAAVEQLPTRADWERERAADGPAVSPADATARFLADMHAAGDPGTVTMPIPKRSAFARTKHLRGWVVRPVDREDFEQPRRYVPGLLLTVDGTFHQLDSELRGWGQRDFPVFQHSVGGDPVEPPRPERLAKELDAVRRAVS
jgi:hypothetical protein